MPLIDTRDGRTKAGLCLVLALAVLSVSLLVFSAWHRHDCTSTSTCPFTQVEHGGGPEDVVDGPVEPQNQHAAMEWLGEARRVPDPCCQNLCCGRAPPVPPKRPSLV
ncbi:MAG TPA: hypothetical protein VGK29_22640 [Paludibaculum sp.]